MGLIRAIVSPFYILLIILISAGTAWFVSRHAENRKLEFSDETAQVRFISFATKISPLRRVELARVEQVEVFERKSEARLFWDRLRLPDVVVSASVPVEYNYYVNLEEDWQLNLTDEYLEIIAPPLTPGTPAPNVSELRFEIKEGSVFRDSRAVARKLQSEITDMLSMRATENTHLAQEVARNELKLLAEAWLKLEGRDVPAVILFKNEISETPK